MSFSHFVKLLGYFLSFLPISSSFFLSSQKEKKPKAFSIFLILAKRPRSDFLHLLLQSNPLIPTHSSILVWRILWTEEPGGLQSMGSQRVRHD